MTSSMGRLSSSYNVTKMSAEVIVASLRLTR